MKAELYMISPEQEFSLNTVQEQPVGGESLKQNDLVGREQWLRLWDRNWIRLWDRNWIRLWNRFWDRAWIRFWDRGWLRWEPPWEIDKLLKGEKLDEIEPIMERMLLRQEKKGFLAMDSLTSRVFKLDEQAGKVVQLVQSGMTPEEAAKELNVKKGELDKFQEFLKEQDVSPEPR